METKKAKIKQKSLHDMEVAAWWRHCGRAECQWVGDGDSRCAAPVEKRPWRQCMRQREPVRSWRLHCHCVAADQGSVELHWETTARCGNHLANAQARGDIEVHLIEVDLSNYLQLW